MMFDESSTKDRGGALDALVNYWITKICSNPRSPAVPEFNLASGGAQAALDRYLAGRELYTAFAFELGLRLAGIVSRSPLNAESEIRAAIDDAIIASIEIAKDEVEDEALKALRAATAGV